MILSPVGLCLAMNFNSGISNLVGGQEPHQDDVHQRFPN